MGGLRLLRAGVVGAGAFGGHHARKYAALDGVELAAILTRRRAGDGLAEPGRAVAGSLDDLW